jgi:glucose uptake protein GlcU
MVTMPVSGGAENVKAMLYGVLIAPAWVSSESRS